MKTLVVVCAVVGSAGPLSASQVLVGRGTVDRNHQEALQHYRLGQDALHNEHFDDAEREFQQAARLDPTLELAPYGLGQVYMATKRYRQAVIAYQKCRDVFQANAAAAVGDEVARQQRIDERIQILEDQQRL